MIPNKAPLPHLVELLVVITIIVVLAALTTVGVTKIRASARGATCTSNLRQVGAAMISYATDNTSKCWKSTA